VKTIEATSAHSWCLFAIEGRHFAVCLAAVAEVIEAEQLVRLPLCSPRVMGLCTFRREPLPVIGLGHAPAAPSGAASRQHVVLILRSEHGSWGAQVDRGVAIVAQGPMDEAGSYPAGANEAVVIGTILRGEVVYSVIDAEATWRNIREAIECWYKGDRDRRHGS
jgi:purine-binding chemotaxis protein CheW